MRIGRCTPSQLLQPVADLPEWLHVLHGRLRVSIARSEGDSIVQIGGIASTSPETTVVGARRTSGHRARGISTTTELAIAAAATDGCLRTHRSLSAIASEEIGSTRFLEEVVVVER